MLPKRELPDDVKSLTSSLPSECWELLPEGQVIDEYLTCVVRRMKTKGFCLYSISRNPSVPSESGNYLRFHFQATVDTVLNLRTKKDSDLSQVLPDDVKLSLDELCDLAASEPMAQIVVD